MSAYVTVCGEEGSQALLLGVRTEALHFLPLFSSGSERTSRIPYLSVAWLPDAGRENAAAELNRLQNAHICQGWGGHLLLCQPTLFPGYQGMKRPAKQQVASLGLQESNSQRSSEEQTALRATLFRTAAAATTTNEQEQTPGAAETPVNWQSIQISVSHGGYQLAFQQHLSICQSGTVRQAMEREMIECEN